MKNFRDNIVFAVMFICVVSFTILVDYALSSVDDGHMPAYYYDLDFIPDHNKRPGRVQPPDQVEPGQARLVFDPATSETCKLRLSFWFPAGAVTAPIGVRAYCTGLPSGVTPLVEQIDSLFFFGAWVRGQGKTVDKFNPSIVIKVKYDDSAFAQIPEIQQPTQPTLNFAFSYLDRSTSLPMALVTYPAINLALNSTLNPYSLVPLLQEEQLRLNMYNPAIKSWVKLCSSVNVYENEIAGGLAAPTPIEEGSNALFGLAVDRTLPLNQVVDSQGNTTLSIEGVNARFYVLTGTVENGIHFEVTPLPGVPESSLVKLLPTPVDIKACQIDHVVVENSRQITQLPKPLRVEFDFDAGILARAGGKANLTIVSLQNDQWIDLEELGYRVIRGENKLTVDTSTLGIFSMAAK